jgi:hypothetical protein
VGLSGGRVEKNISDYYAGALSVEKILFKTVE